MAWIMIGIVASSIVVSGHDTKEACEGRAVILREQKVAAKCVEAPRENLIFYSGGNGSGSITLTPAR